jgi:predicted deacetylase
MIPRPAQYILRFDDLCPTVSRSRWQRFLPLIEEFGLRPILAIVPSNQDQRLVFSPADPEFWSQMRAMEASGAAIALHGFRHLCQSRHGGLVPLNRETEFAGVPIDTQRAWIRAGLEILRGQGLNPRIWVSPRHGFDRATLRVLREEGIAAVSDGFARRPFKRGGMVWIPQQLWAPVARSSGLWTICLHPNSAPDALVRQLREFLVRHAGSFTSVERVLAEMPATGLSPLEMFTGTAALLRVRARRIRKRLLGRI